MSRLSLPQRPADGLRARRRSRLVGVDAARGVALLGMMAVHILPTTGPDGLVTRTYAVTGGRAAALFAVLAGVGLALWSGGPHHRPGEGAAPALAVRALLIGIVGLLLELVDSGIAVILPYYAVLFLLAIPLLGRSRRTLVVLALAAAVVVPPLSHVLRAETFVGASTDPLTVLALTGTYPVLAWSTYLCVGLAVGRLPLRSPQVAAGLLVGGAALAVAAKGASWLLLEVAGGRERLAAARGLEPDSATLEYLLTSSRHGTTPTETWWWLAVSGPHTTTTFDLLHTTGTSLAVLGTALLLTRLSARPLVPLAAAGAIPLTLYTAHVLTIRLPVWPADETVSFLVQVASALALACAWRLTGWRGPLEAGIAALSGRAHGHHPAA